MSDRPCWDDGYLAADWRRMGQRIGSGLAIARVGIMAVWQRIGSGLGSGLVADEGTDWQRIGERMGERIGQRIGQRIGGGLGNEWGNGLAADSRGSAPMPAHA